MYSFLRWVFGFVGMILLYSCGFSNKIQREVKKSLLADSLLSGAHLGIAVFDPERNHFVYRYQPEKYFVPASNVKIISLYAGLKYLGDSLIGLKYKEGTDTLFIEPAGDPSFLHPDFNDHPVLTFLERCKKPIAITTNNWNANAWGKGWMWDDYNEAFMPERSPFPLYGNVISWNQVRDSSSIGALAREEAFIYSVPDINWKVHFSGDTAARRFSVVRSLTENRFFITQGREINARQEVPFITRGLQSTVELLSDLVITTIDTTAKIVQPDSVIYSQPTDALLRKMMYRSDNFYAEQLLLMAASQLFGVMDDQRLIQYLLKSDLQGFPQKPRWVDGSGLSRYNLFTPEDMVWILGKMEKDFGAERLKGIFPAGEPGTLHDSFKEFQDRIYAKSGSMSGVFCLSGYLQTQSGKWLIFSVMINNYTKGGGILRSKVASFLKEVMMKY